MTYYLHRVLDVPVCPELGLDVHVPK